MCMTACACLCARTSRDVQVMVHSELVCVFHCASRAVWPCMHLTRRCEALIGHHYVHLLWTCLELRSLLCPAFRISCCDPPAGHAALTCAHHTCSHMLTYATHLPASHLLTSAHNTTTAHLLISHLRPICRPRCSTAAAMKPCLHHCYITGIYSYTKLDPCAGHAAQRARQ